MHWGRVWSTPTPTVIDNSGIRVVQALDGQNYAAVSEMKGLSLRADYRTSNAVALAARA